MAVDTLWDDDDGWLVRLKCDYCFEPVYNTGPDRRGNREAALLRDEHRIRTFCSPECRAAWMAILHEGHTERLEVADNVGQADLEALLPDGSNAGIEWPE